MSIEQRVYRKSKAQILSVIQDVMERQKGKELFADTQKGQIFFRTSMYGNTWENRFTVFQEGEGCMVQLELTDSKTRRQLDAMFALMESLMQRYDTSCTKTVLP